MDYAGYYINLDRAHERRAQIEAELAAYGLSGQYARFAAADGNILNMPARNLTPAQLGCWTSHYLLLKENRDRGQHLHVMEDDVVFASCAAQAIEWAIASGHLDAYDIIFTDVFVPLHNQTYKAYRELYDKAVQRDAAGKITQVAFDVIDLAGKSYAASSSFLVSKNAVQKLHDLFEAEVKQGPHLQVDLFMRKKSFEGVLKIGCIFPFVTSVRLDQSLTSSIDPRDNRQSELAADLARYAFFVGCDWDLCRAYVAKHLPLPPPEDRLTHLLGHLLTYSLTDRYRFF